MVERVCEACKESIGPFAPLLGEVGGRMQDKKTGVKATARANLCALYRQHLSSASLQWVHRSDPRANCASPISRLSLLKVAE